MTTNQDRLSHAASFVATDGVRLWLYRKTSTPEVSLVVVDYEAVVSASFSLNRFNLERLITALQHESERLKAPEAADWTVIS